MNSFSVISGLLNDFISNISGGEMVNTKLGWIEVDTSADEKDGDTAEIPTDRETSNKGSLKGKVLKGTIQPKN